MIRAGTTHIYGMHSIVLSSQGIADPARFMQQYLIDNKNLKAYI